MAISLETARFNVGRRVVYRPSHGAAEEGRITSANDNFVFVRFGNDSTSKACRAEDLEYAA